MSTIQPNGDRPAAQRNEWLTMLWQMPLGLLIIYAMYHTFTTRSFNDFLHYSTIIALCLAPFAIIAGASAWYSAEDRVSWLVVLGIAIGGATFLLLASVVYYSILAALKDFALWMVHLEWRSGVEWRLVIVGASVLIGGVILFVFRLYLRSVYGVTEVIAGVVVALSRVPQVAPDTPSVNLQLILVLLTAGVYLVVRGLANVHEGLGLKKQPPDPVGALVMKWLRRQPLISGALPPAAPGDGEDSSNGNHEPPRGDSPPRADLPAG